jgi:mycothiol synthase
MTIRPLDRPDAEALLQIWNAAAPLDPLTPALLEEKIWGDEDTTTDLALLAEDAGQIAGFATGVVRQPGERGVVKLIAVAPPRWREGIGGQLLRQLESAMRQRGASAVRLGEAAPNYLLPGIDPRYTRAMLFFEGRGYRRIGETYNLDVDLGAEDWSTAAREQELAMEGVTVRRAASDDRLAVDAFLDEHWPAWKAEVSRALERRPVALHVAFRQRGGEEPELLGFSAYDSNNLGTGWFGPMGTAPAARGLGIGSVLLRRCLRDQRAQGLQRAIIPWVGPIAFYAHYADAAISRVFYRYEKTLGREAAE